MYLIISDLKTQEQNAINEFVNEKEAAYNEYQDKLKKIDNSEDTSRDFNIVKESIILLEKIQEMPEKDTAYYEQKMQAFDKYISNKEEEVLKDLNDSYANVLNYTLENNDFSYYEKLGSLNCKYYYLNEENDELKQKVSDEFYRYTRELKKNKEETEVESNIDLHTSYKPSAPTLREGMSKAEVRAALGSPPTTYKTSGGEIWVYGEIVILIGDGYVVNVSYPLD